MATEWSKAEPATKVSIFEFGDRYIKVSLVRPQYQKQSCAERKLSVAMLDLSMAFDGVEEDFMDLASLIAFDDTPHHSGFPAASSTDSTRNSSSEIIPKKPKRIRNRHPGVVIFPRIVKMDVRRKYPLMFVNVANSMDGDLAVRYFTQFCTQSCQWVDTTLHPITREAAHVKVFSGLGEIVGYCRNGPTPPVDFTLHLQDACIKQSTQYSGSKIVMKLIARCSSLSLSLQSGQSCVDASDSDSSLTTAEAEDQPVKKPATDALSMVSYSGESVDIGFLSVTLKLDTQHRFQHVDMESDFFLGNENTQ
eukprot:gene30641-37023_t